MDEEPVDSMLEFEPVGKVVVMTDVPDEAFARADMVAEPAEEYAEAIAGSTVTAVDSFAGAEVIM